ncbi:MAG: fumarylacetoacetate hydrolase family protein [Pirellulales bacterium]|jgi:2-dehydro-3-deoxy-D-arabinonate dehydratase|nr:fumarylacetoacetate hydrolase family protein [Pirellulales bacterium]
MQLAKYRTSSGETGFGVLEGSKSIVPLGDHPSCEAANLFELLEADEIVATLTSLLASEDVPSAIAIEEVQLEAPLDGQEVWAAGVTYKRSKTARMEESAAAASCYDRVYASDRPELFFKATPNRVAGPGQPVRIRVDASWNVPEPELALVINSRKQLVGFTVGNDMSSRDIEGDNPLYLAQAKVYNQSCGLGPWITLSSAMPPRSEIGIQLQVFRNTERVFHGETHIEQMARSFEDLIGWLGRDNSFPAGAILLTGTGIVPENDFTLLPGDRIDISIDGIGTLSAPVIQGS